MIWRVMEIEEGVLAKAVVRQFIRITKCEMFHHFLLPWQNNTTSSQAFSVAVPISDDYAVLLTSFSGYRKRHPNLVITS